MPWKKWILTRTHMNQALGFHVCLCKDGAGKMFFSGHFTDSDGIAHESEAGRLLSEEAANALGNLHPDTLPGKRRIWCLPFLAADRCTVKCTVYFDKGPPAKKRITDVQIDTVLRIIAEDLCRTPV